MPDALPDFPFDAAPRSDHREKRGAGADRDLRFLIVRGRDRYLGRTLCDTCSEESPRRTAPHRIESEKTKPLA